MKKSVKRIVMPGMLFCILNLISGIMITIDDPQNIISMISVICNVITIVILTVLLRKIKEE